MRKWMIAFAPLLALPGLAQAQQVVITPVERPATEVGIAADLGAWFPTNTNIADTGFAFGVRAGYAFAPWVSLEAAYLGTARIENSDIPNLAGESLRFDSGTLSLRFSARRTLAQPVNPYALIGLGIYGFSGSGVNLPGAPRSGARFEIPLGIGLQFALGPNVSLGAEGKYLALFEGARATPTVDRTDAFSVLGTLTFRL